MGMSASKFRRRAQRVHYGPQCEPDTLSAGPELLWIGGRVGYVVRNGVDVPGVATQCQRCGDDPPLRLGIERDTGMRRYRLRCQAGEFVEGEGVSQCLMAHCDNVVAFGSR